MARITGITPGLNPEVLDAPSPKPKPPKEKLSVTVFPTVCAACEGKLVLKRKGRGEITKPQYVEDNDEAFCLNCAKFFGYVHPGFGGVTNVSHRHAAEIIEKAKETQWIMVLRTPGAFTNPFNGQHFVIELGDILKIKIADANPNEECSLERTRTKFSITVHVGRNDLVLWPHEFSPINWIRIMQLRQAGEIEEQYLEASDDVGYYAPTKAMRKLINATFGNR